MRRSIITPQGVVTALALGALALAALVGPALANNEAPVVKSAGAFCSFNGYSKVPCGVAIADLGDSRGVAFNDGSATMMFVGGIIDERSSGVEGVMFSEDEFYAAQSGVCLVKPEYLTCTALVRGVRITATATRGN